MEKIIAASCNQVFLLLLLASLMVTAEILDTTFLHAYAELFKLAVLIYETRNLF
ncbi:hypothetical protein SLEP1_g25719 [Rubroshorea leprosula]|uniref:Uncharacterized protein n=1 Tax=Rubroshorea leprosula TaxID=152421 RepID=A0AAV5JUD1_9ROSI|nr:hypothetical protein SLEP1_g25719 [Rubroshorea leprosula]